MNCANFTRPGALVISLDFEQVWGVRDIYPANHPYMLRVLNERKVVPGILDLFEEYEIGATWATVGFMFAKTRQEAEHFSPDIRPQYINSRLNPYLEAVGEGEWDDPLHYAPEIIQQIRERRRQEIATHTFSHYYCLESGQSREAFAADLDSALAIARKDGIKISSIVFPRNQHNPDYNDILLERGIICYRGTENHGVYRVKLPTHNLPHKRIYRLVDTFTNLSGFHLVGWEDIVAGSGLCNVASSRYLRPINKFTSTLSALRLHRISSAMKAAAEAKKVFHLWMHPQDFGQFPEENLKGLRDILECFSGIRRQYGMISLNMMEAAEEAKRNL